jgi:hypothetical protein
MHQGGLIMKIKKRETQKPKTNMAVMYCYKAPM